jgi:excinuclease UvrABC nuclease subunit
MKKSYVKVHPNSIKNLRMITSPEMAKEYQAKSVESRKRNSEAIKALTEEFQCSAEAVKKVLSQVDIKAIDVLKLSMMHALNQDNFEDAARYAKEIAEFEMPKLARLEQTNTTKVEDLTDEELQKILKSEGL